MTGLWITLGITAFIIWCFATPKQPAAVTTAKKPTRPEIPYLGVEGDIWEDEYHTYIAGINHHASKYDIGGFRGYVMRDPNNTHDKNAMGVYSRFKLLGYIPASELEDYIDWCEGKPTPCAGFVYVEDGQYRGRVKILKPCSEDFVNTEFKRYSDWVRENYGEKYAP